MHTQVPKGSQHSPAQTAPLDRPRSRTSPTVPFSPHHIVQLQKTIGNRAVIQLLAANVQATPHVLQQKRKATASEASPGIVQRSADAKNLINNTNDNTVVPDLPNEYVTKIQAAHSNEQRQAVLDELYDYLFGCGLIDNVTSFKYVTKDDLFGITEYLAADQVEDEEGVEDTAGFSNVCISISSLAFTSGPAVVYSTLRHELIHAEQMKLEVDDVASEKDVVFYGDESAHTGYIRYVQYALQEIEAHVWEIEHAAKTGISPEFLQNRFEFLKNLYETLIVNGSRLGKKQQTKWYQYVKKAKAMAEKVLAGQKGFAPKSINWLE